jgi:hypothetical protein
LGSVCVVCLSSRFHSEGSTYPWWPSRASGVDRDEMGIIRVHVAGMQNPGISEACRLCRSDPMGTSVALILDRRHHVAQLDLTPNLAARDRTALADLPHDRRQKVSLLVKKLLRVPHDALPPCLLRQAFLFFPSKHERNRNTSPKHACGRTHLPPHPLHGQAVHLPTLGTSPSTIRTVTSTRHL